jgi:DNA polymerase-4
MALEYERMFVSAQSILHIDMDAFFASVEQARRPELRGRPVIVGGPPGTRSVVATASYEARAFGVRTAMPTARAQQLCPQAVFLRGDLAAYAAVHERLVDVFRLFTDRVQVVSIDEAYLDVSGCRRLFGPPRAIACRIQELVYDREGITCSIGIGSGKLLARLASELAKPAGLGELTETDVHGRLRELPVRDLLGIGAVTEARLAALGITTVALLQDAPLPLLSAAFGNGAHALKRLAFGRSLASPVRSRRRLPKSLGKEVTFDEDTADGDRLRATLLRLVDHAMTRLRAKGLAARTVTLKLRYSTFHTITRRATLPHATGATRPVYEVAGGLLDHVALDGRLVRLLGVSLGDLHARSFQLTLDDVWKETSLDEAVDRIRARYGTASIGRAAGALASSTLLPARREAG